MEDRQLLQLFVEQQSQAAFGELVQRHKDWVYSACLRRLGDASLAEDATQVVFVALMHKAPRLANVSALSPWLHQTAKYAAANIQRMRARRARYESEAAMMRAQSESELQADWGHVATELEPALDRLRFKDRQTILLRFYEQKTHSQIADILEITEEAAKKRLSRAIERLRAVLARQGVTVGASCLAGLMLTHMTGVAPVSVAASVSAAVGSQSAGQLGTMSPLLKGWAATTQFKVAAGIVAIVLAAPVPILLMQQKSAPSAMAQAPMPTTNPVPAVSNEPAIISRAPIPLPASTMRLANIVLRTDAPAGTDFVAGIDPKVVRVPGSAPAGYLKSSAPLKTSVSRAAIATPYAFLGKRVRLSGWVKTSDLENWAGLMLIVVGPNQKFHAASNMGPNPIAGTTDWTQYSLVADVPADTDHLYISMQLYGKGELWTDDLQIEIVPDSVPITDDRVWHKWSLVSPRYSAKPDPNVQRDGRPMMCISSNETATSADWVCYDHYNRSIEQYRGHTVRMTAWMKTADVRRDAGMWIRVVGAGDKYIAGEVAPARRHMHGTMDWTKFTIQAQVPMNAEAIGTGFVMDGSGKMWVDTEKVEIELVD